MENTAFDIVCFGETLFDIIGNEPLPGGAPLNVAYHLRNLGLNPTIISSIGNDELGDQLRSILHSYNITTSYIQSNPTYPTGKVFAELQPGNQVKYDIVKPVAWDFIESAPGIEQLVTKAPYFVYGSLASRSETTKTTLLQLLAKANKKVLDVNLRPPHYTQELIIELITAADILKLNDVELAIISSWFTNKTDERARMQILKDRFNLETVIVTKGEEGATVLNENEWQSHKGFTVKVADTIGSGDAFLAAYLFKTYQQVPTAQALEFACATGSLVASLRGACPAYSVNKIHQLINQRA
jgi:fructokinase